MNEKKYQAYIKSNNLFDFKDKLSSVNIAELYMLNRTRSMFEWQGLPESLPSYILETYIQAGGYAIISKVDDKLYAFPESLGGVPNAYYEPTQCIVANPYLKYNAVLEIGTDCVVIRNDLAYMGLIPLINKYATLLTENELSMWVAEINSRIQTMLSASDDVTKESAQKYLDGLLKGDFSVIANNAFLDDLKAYGVSGSDKSQTLGQLIEMEQYLKASMYNELGLNANYNMKREALNTAESTINNDILFPLVDTMLYYRQLGCKQCNKLFDTDISVRLASSWMDNKKEEQSAVSKDGDDDNADSDT